MGNALVYASALAEMERRDAESLRKLLLSDDWLDCALRAFRKRLEDGERDAVRLYMQEVARLRNEKRVVVVFLERLGVTSLDEAERLIKLAREADEMDPDMEYQAALKLVQRYREVRGLAPLAVPERARARLGEGATLRLRGDSGAEVIP